MRKQTRSEERTEGRGEGAAGDRAHKELEPLLWQAHVNEEMDRLVREHKPAPPLPYFAEEYAARAMRGLEMSPNEYQEASRRGETRGGAEAASELASAGDIAGG